MVIDGHTHACGKYLTADGIRQKLNGAGADAVILTPGAWNSCRTYRMKNAAEKASLQDMVPSVNRRTRFLIPLKAASGNPSRR